MSSPMELNMHEQSTEPVIDFENLDQYAFDATLDFLRANPEPPKELTDSVKVLLGGAIGEHDWIDPDDLWQKYTPFHCGWSHCKNPMKSAEELNNHLERHSEEVLQRWVPNTLCLWEGCHSQAKFSSIPKFKTHLKNIHTQPLLCQIPRCSYKKPFRHAGDLERHVATIHRRETRPYVCPFQSCNANLTSFNRKDKLLKHLQETEHIGDMFCFFPHCIEYQPPRFTGFKTRKEIAVHFSQYHSYVTEVHQCALGLCALNLTQEGWHTRDLYHHLRTCHDVSDGTSYSRAKREGDSYILRPGHLQKCEDTNEPETEWQECSICLQRQQTEPTTQAAAIDLVSFQQFIAVAGNVDQPITSGACE